MNTKEKNDLKDYRPMKFVDRMERNKHIILLYDDQKYAYWILGRYFHNGLAKGQSCIFFAPNSPEIMEKQLSASGIDVRSFKMKDRLRIFEVERSDDNKHEKYYVHNQIREYTKGMKPPYRLAGRMVTDIGTKNGMNIQILQETTGHQHFDEFNCSQICHYDISRIEPTRKHEWISLLLRNHHYVIYAAEPDKAVAFETALLEQDDDSKYDNNNLE